MQVPENAPIVARVIGGVTVNVPKPFVEGQPITSGMAAMLNQTFFENVGNNLRKKVVNEDGTPKADAQSIVDAYVNEYEPGARISTGGGGKVALTPLEREIRDLASEKLKKALKNKGLKQNEVNFTELRDGLIEKHREALETQAKGILKAKEKASASTEDLLDGVDLGQTTGPEDEEPSEGEDGEDGDTEEEEEVAA